MKCQNFTSILPKLSQRQAIRFTLHSLSSLPEYMTLPLSSAKHTALTSDYNKNVLQILVSFNICTRGES